ncbi:MAG: hypothetical protein KDB29_04650, partial [Planctomycetes bacterium]|nr:hypothetical protein [Planctomycetota bacterium]
QPAGTVAPSGTTTFDVQVIAPATGTFSFTMSIASDDPDEDPYVVNFSGNTGAGTVIGGGGGGGGGGGCATATTGSYAWVLLALLVIPAIITRRRKA